MKRIKVSDLTKVLNGYFPYGYTMIGEYHADGWRDIQFTCRQNKERHVLLNMKLAGEYWRIKSIDGLTI